MSSFRIFTIVETQVYQKTSKNRGNKNRNKKKISQRTLYGAQSAMRQIATYFYNSAFGIY